jgi:hypothetical protein
MASFGADWNAALTVASLVLALVSLAVAVLVLVQLRRLKRPFRDMAEIFEKKGSESALEELLKGVDENREFLRGHSEELKRILELLAGCYCTTGLVKYNAFEDIGGMQSYSLCILTREKNGFILTNLVGRTSTRGYALDVREGKPSRQLSDEEKEALETALRTLAVPGR